MVSQPNRLFPTGILAKQHRPECTESAALQSATPNMYLWNLLRDLADLLRGPAPTDKAPGSYDEELFDAPTATARSSRPTPLTAKDLEILSDVVTDCCHRFGYIDDFEDMYQDMVVEALRLDIMGRYDETLSAKKTYLKRFVYHRFINAYERDRRILDRTALYRDEPNEQPPSTASLPDINMLSAFEAIAQQLRLHFPPESAAVYEGEPLAFVHLIRWRDKAYPKQRLVWRCHGNIFRMLCLGLQQQEIAHILQLSKGNVCHRVDDIRRWPGVLGLQQLLKTS